VSKKRNRSRQRKNKGLQQAIVAGIILAVALVGVQLWANQSVAYYEGLPFSGTTLGDPDAPVTVVEYFDFQCPACQAASNSIVKPLVENYVASGDVEFTYKFFPILDDRNRGVYESTRAAIAGFCAAEQDGFWPYQQILFARRGTGNRGEYSDRNLISFARQAGLNVDEFTECFNSDYAGAYIENERLVAAYQLGLLGTPTFFVNNRPVNGTWRDIEQAIEEALASARGE